MDKNAQLATIAKDIIAAGVCPELASGARQLVPGAGNADADVMFIGEAPGKREDALGLPFVGAAGKFLDEMLGEINLTREDVYITNIVKYRPPANRDPLPEEIAAFMPYLFRQVAVIEPKLLVTLGRFATNVFLPKLKISQVHGQPKKIKLKLGDGANEAALAAVIMPLYHPAAALYNGGMRQTLLADFRKLPKTLELIESENKTTINK